MYNIFYIFYTQCHAIQQHCLYYSNQHLQLILPQYNYVQYKYEQYKCINVNQNICLHLILIFFTYFDCKCLYVCHLIYLVLHWNYYTISKLNIHVSTKKNTLLKLHGFWKLSQNQKNELMLNDFN